MLRQKRNKGQSERASFAAAHGASFLTRPSVFPSDCGTVDAQAHSLLRPPQSVHPEDQNSAIGRVWSQYFLDGIEMSIDARSGIGVKFRTVTNRITKILYMSRVVLPTRAEFSLRWVYCHHRDLYFSAAA